MAYYIYITVWALITHPCPNSSAVQLSCLWRHSKDEWLWTQEIYDGIIYPLIIIDWLFIREIDTTPLRYTGTPLQTQKFQKRTFKFTSLILSKYHNSPLKCEIGTPRILPISPCMLLSNLDKVVYLKGNWSFISINISEQHRVFLFNYQEHHTSLIRSKIHIFSSSKLSYSHCNPQSLIAGIFVSYVVSLLLYLTAVVSSDHFRIFIKIESLVLNILLAQRSISQSSPFIPVGTVTFTLFIHCHSVKH